MFFHLALQLSLPNPLQPGVKSRIKMYNVVGAAPVGAAPTTSEWSTILLPTKVLLTIEVLWYTVCVSVNLAIIGSDNG